MDALLGILPQRKLFDLPLYVFVHTDLPLFCEVLMLSKQVKWFDSECKNHPTFNSDSVEFCAYLLKLQRLHRIYSSSPQDSVKLDLIKNIPYFLCSLKTT